MSDKITQTLGIDAGQALDALKQLDSAFKGFEARLQSTAQAIKGFNDSAKGVDKLGDAFKSNIPASTKEVEKLTVSLGLLSRVVFTQLIVHALSFAMLSSQQPNRRLISKSGLRSFARLTIPAVRSTSLATPSAISATSSICRCWKPPAVSIRQSATRLATSAKA
jgi:hypothetical protein